jgi:GT2 family glycosyltransferase
MNPPPAALLGRTRDGDHGAHFRLVETPSALITSLEESFRLASVVEPGDTLLGGDRDGRLGLFALAEAMRDPTLQRRLVLVAGEAHVLERLWVAGTLDGVEPGLESVLDWEIAALRFARAVVTPSAIAAQLLAHWGIREDVAVVDVGTPGPRTPRTPDASLVWLPERPSRRAQSAKILRGLSAVPGAKVVVSRDSEADLVWHGSVLDSVAELLSAFGGRAQLAKRPGRKVSLVILGDPFAVPPSEVERLRDSGTPVGVPAGSTAAGLWPDALVWRTEDDVAAIAAGGVRGSAGPSGVPMSVATGRSRPTRASRARAVSVGVPIFRNVQFLDECVESLLAQSQPPIEVLLLDDGSNSPEVDAAITAWTEREPRVLRRLRQPNRGVCTARNRMLIEMRGDAFVFVDSDDVLDATFIEKTALALRANPGIDVVATWTEFFGDYTGVEAKPPFDARVGRRENPIISTCSLVDMSVRDRGIRFQPDLAFIYCEDWDFWSQIAASGGKFGLVPEPLARHRVHYRSGARSRTEVAHRIGKARATARLYGLDPASSWPELFALSAQESDGTTPGSGGGAEKLV